MWNSHLFINVLLNLSDLFVPNIFFNILWKNQLIQLFCSIFAQNLNETCSSLILPQKQCLLRRYWVLLLWFFSKRACWKPFLYITFFSITADFCWLSVYLSKIYQWIKLPAKMLHLSDCLNSINTQFYSQKKTCPCRDYESRVDGIISHCGRSFQSHFILLCVYILKSFGPYFQKLRCQKLPPLKKK